MDSLKSIWIIISLTLLIISGGFYVLSRKNIIRKHKIWFDKARIPSEERYSYYSITDSSVNHIINNICEDKSNQNYFKKI